MGIVLFPPHIIDDQKRVVFLAGPIQGAPYWHKEAIALIHGIDDEIAIACPRRPIPLVKANKKDYEEQVDWETFYLNIAGSDGVILFWLAKEAEHICKRAYAQTSRFELGEWKTKHITENANLVLGIESGFTNEKYILRRFSQDCPDIKICQTLEETCRQASSLFRQKSF